MLAPPAAAAPRRGCDKFLTFSSLSFPIFAPKNSYCYDTLFIVYNLQPTGPCLTLGVCSCSEDFMPARAGVYIQPLSLDSVAGIHSLMDDLIGLM